MVSKITHFIDRELPPNVIPYICDAAALLLTMQTVQNVVNGSFYKRTEAERSYITLAASALVIGVLSPFSRGACGFIAVAWLVTAVARYRNGSKEKVSQPLPLPECIQSLLQKPLRLSERIHLPQSISSLFEQIKAGQHILVKSADGWDKDFFIWTLKQNSKFSGYSFYLFSDNTSSDIDELKQYIDRHPKCVIITDQQLLEELVLPKETYLLGCFPANEAQEGIALQTLTEKETVDLLTEWVNSHEYSSLFPNVRFEGESITRIYQFAQKNKSVSVFSAVSDFSDFDKVKFVVTHSPSDKAPNQLQIHSLVRHINPKHLMKVAAVFKKIGMDIIYHPGNGAINPEFIKQIPKGAGCEARTDQSGQIIGALGGEKKPHAIVVGFDPDELENVLSMPTIQSSVCRLDVDSFLRDKDSNLNLLLDYLLLNPDIILYIPALFKLLKDSDVKASLFRYLPPQTSILSHQKNRSLLVALTSGQLSSKEDEYLDDFKRVQLMPLTQKQCLEEVKTWGQKYTFEANALEIAVECSFLLHEGNGTEFTFIKDLIERTPKKDTPITADDIWKSFISLYHLHAEQKKEEQSLFNPTSQKIRSLLSIALALKKKYDVVLPVMAVKLSEPPEFLTDLNEKVKGLAEFAVSVGERLEDLANALEGQYHNALIIAPSGSGKTTLVKQAAWMSVSGTLKAEHPLYGKTIYVLNLETLMGGTKYVGVLDEKIDELFNFLMQSKNAVLFIDEIHRIMGAGVTEGNKMGSISQYMKSRLEELGISVIGATTGDEYEKWVEKDEAFVRRFNTMTLDEPTKKDAYEIFSRYISSAEFEKLKSPVKISHENIDTVWNLIQSTKSNISLIDRGKKLLEQIAKSAKRSKQTTIDESFIKELTTKK